MSELEISVSCVINRAPAGDRLVHTHSDALCHMDCVPSFWNIHKRAMAEPALAESDDKPRREVMTRYMCLLAVAVLPLADLVPSTEAGAGSRCFNNCLCEWEWLLFASRRNTGSA